jgi:hypothetical protein
MLWICQGLLSMLKSLTNSSPSNGSEIDLRVPFPVGHELWALWAASMINSPVAPASEEETPSILHGQRLIDVDPGCRIDGIWDEESDGPAPAVAQSGDFSSVESQQSLESQALVPFVESFGDPITELSGAEDPVPTVAEVARTKVRYLPDNLNVRNPSRTRRKSDKPVPANNPLGRAGRRRCLRCRKRRQKVSHLVNKRS